MTRIKASCPSCGDVELLAPQIRLVIASVQDRSFYAFTCPKCHAEVRKTAPTDVQALLRTGGVMPERWHIPAEALELHVGPRISPDDYLDAALLLGREETDVLAVLYRETVKGEMA